jgi:hypothetical protein
MSGKPQLGKVISVIKDPMLSDQFTLEFPSVPTGDADSEPLMIHCQQATKPGLTLNEVQVQLFGHTLVYAGNLTYSHDMSTTFVENVRGGIMRIIENWAEKCRNHLTQHGGFYNDYARDGKLTIFDNAGAAALIYKIVGMWPNTVPETQFDGTNANLITHSVGFKYQYYECIGGQYAGSLANNSPS